MPEVSRPPAWRLFVKPPGAASFTQDVPPDGVVIGRSREAGLQLPDDALSRRHARVLIQGDALMVEDLGSRNGTFLNDAPVTRRTALKESDRLVVGGTEIEARRLTPLRMTSDAGELRDATAVFDVTSLSGNRPRALFVDLEEENRALALMSQAGTLLIAHRTLGETLEALLDLALEGLDAERAAVALHHEDQEDLELACVRGRRGARPLQLSRTVAQAVLEGRKAVAITDVEGDPRMSTAESVRLQGVHSLACAPLWDGTRVQGLLYVDRRIGRGSYGENDVKVLSLLGNLVAIKLENSRLVQAALDAKQMEHELDVARRIQQKLMPSAAPVTDKLDLAGECLSCQAIGGDFFDFMPLPNGRWGIVVADVCGKGVGGALLAASLQAALRGGRSLEASPSGRLAWLNEFVHEHSPVDRYITAAWIEIDPATGELQHAVAGHPAPLIVSPTGGVRRLVAGGLPLGLFADAAFDQGRDRLMPGERLVLYTDGIVEACPAGVRDKPFGVDGLLSTLTAIRGSARETCSGILESVDAFTGGAPLRDDATVLVAALA